LFNFFLFNIKLLQLETVAKLTEMRNFFKYSFVVPLYGISKDPDTKNFILVFKYIDSNFQHYYRIQKFNPVILGAKLVCISLICFNLGFIHANNLVHRDFHVGNILQGGVRTYISDFGLCKPANETNDQKIYGVLPYIAPEVLRGKPYTEKSDIYSLGIVINTIISGKLPFDDRSFNRYLIIDICRYGLRPEIRNETPQALKELIQKCWDENPENRPTASEICNQLAPLLTFPELNGRIVEDSFPSLELLAFPKSHPQVNSKANYKSRLLDLPDLTELEPESTPLPYSIQVKTGKLF
jgi:serine/threonine protein kinase